MPPLRPLAALGLVLLTACGDSPSAASASPEPTGQAAGARGEVVAVSDVASIEDSPIRDGSVIAIPAGRATELWSASGLEAPGPADLPYWQPSVARSAVIGAGGTLAAIDAAGTFSLDAAPGRYLLCLTPGGEPLQLRGCAPVSLAGGDRLRLTHGEGGLQVEGG